DQQHHDHDRPDRPLCPRHQAVPDRHQTHRQRRRRPRHHPPRLPPRLELHHATPRHAVNNRHYFFAGPNGIRYLQSRRIANAVVQHFQPKMYAMGHYPRLTYPLTSPLFGPFPWHESKTLAFRLIGLFTLILRTGSLTAPVLLEGWWFVRLFQTF